MMRHVVAGGAGFLGSHLVDALIARGDEVVAIDSLVTSTGENVAHLKEQPRFAFIRADVSRPFDVEGRVDRVWNLASPASPPDYMRLPFETLAVGSEGTRRLLELARAKGARFLQASTSEVYGDPEISPQVESYWGRVNPVGPRSVYDESKRFSEALVTAYGTYHGLPVRIARIFNTYGPRMRLDDGRVIPNFIGQAMRKEPLTIYGEGRQTRSLCYVADEVEGLRRLMESDHVGPMNVGNPNEMTILELARAFEKAFGRPLGMESRPMPTDDPKQRCPDITLARRVLGWEPRVSIDEGLLKTIAWFESR